MNIFRFLGDISHLVSFILLLHKVTTNRSITGISLKSQVLYFLVFFTRYLDLYKAHLWIPYAYNTIFKIAYLAATSYTIYLMVYKYKPTGDPYYDIFPVRYLLIGSAVLALLFTHKYTGLEVCWTFSIWLESVAIGPQLLMLKRTGETDNITWHYIFALGLYRALYIPNWIYRYFFEIPAYVDYNAWTAGLLQTAIYTDFFYIYYQKIANKKTALPV